MRCGDLLFFKATNKFDYFTRKASPTYTHVGMFIDHHHYIESCRSGIRISKITPEDILRCDFFTFSSVSQRKRMKAALLGARYIGRKYPYILVFSSWIHRMYSLHIPVNSSFMFCSQFIAFLIRDAQGMGLSICPHLELKNIFPDDLAGSNLLRKYHV
jgi:uncharacterized protein YycO